MCQGGVVTITITDDLWVELVLHFLAKVLKMELEVLIGTIDVIKVMDTPSPESTASILFRFEPDVPPETRRSITDELKNCYLRYCYSSNPMKYKGEQYNIELKDSAIILPNNQVYVELNITKSK